MWGLFLVERGIVDREHYERENERYYQDYLAGNLDIDEFLRFTLQPLAAHSLEELQRWRIDFMAEKISPIILPRARQLLARHRSQGDRLLIITATNAFITRPIADALGVEQLIATDPEMRQGRYTGEVAGVPCFREGKVVRLKAWLQEHDLTLIESWFYSDSHNDIPLLEQVSHPTAVDPDETLSGHAAMRGWPVISLRGS